MLGHEADGYYRNVSPQGHQCLVSLANRFTVGRLLSVVFTNVVVFLCLLNRSLTTVAFMMSASFYRTAAAWVALALEEPGSSPCQVLLDLLGLRYVNFMVMPTQMENKKH